MLGGATLWILGRLLWRTRQKRERRKRRDTNPSELSAEEKQREIDENLASVWGYQDDLERTNELRRELEPMVRELEEKREEQTLEIVAFGTVSSGKSSLLNALAGCVTTAMVAHAAVRGIHIEELESELEGDIDLRGFLGLAKDVPKGYTDIRVRFKAKADVKNLERLRRLTEFSPVLNTITSGAHVDVQVDPM